MASGIISRRIGGFARSAAVVVAVAAFAPTGLGADVVTNGGAEADAGSDHSGERVVRPSGWQQVEGGMSVQRYGTGGFPGGGGSGSNLFTGGRSATSSIRQATSLVASAGAIDTGGQTAMLSARLGGYSTQDDHATVTADFLDENGTRLSALALGPVTRSDRGDETTLVGRTASGPILTGTRTVVVTLTATRVAGASNDGYIDDVVLDLSIAPGGAPAAPQVIPRVLSARNPTVSYTTASGAKLIPRIAIVRHGARVRFCNRSPVYRQPFLGIPSGGFVLSRKAKRPPSSVTGRSCAGACTLSSPRLLAPGRGRACGVSRRSRPVARRSCLAPDRAGLRPGVGTPACTEAQRQARRLLEDLRSHRRRSADRGVRAAQGAATAAPGGRQGRQGLPPERATRKPLIDNGQTRRRFASACLPPCGEDRAAS